MASKSSNLNNHPFFGWQPPLSVYNYHAEFYHPILKAAGMGNEQVHCVFDISHPDGQGAVMTGSVTNLTDPSTAGAQTNTDIHDIRIASV